MQDNLTSRIDQDLDRRSINGSYAYLAVWSVIGFTTGFSNDHGFIFWGLFGVLLFFAATRLLLSKFSSGIREHNRNLWLGLFLLNALGPSSVYSITLSLSFFDPVFSPIMLYLLMTVFAFVSGGVINFSPNPKVLFAFLVVLVVPSMFTAMTVAQEHFPVGVLLVVYAVFMFAQSNRLIGDYHQMIKQQVQLEEINTQDPLTGIGNRRLFDESLSLAWKTKLRSAKSVGLLIIDIDHFKSINDTHGHAAGDEVIKAIAECLRQCCQRETDIIARFGGEEFTVLIAPTSKNEIEGLAEKIRTLVEASTVQYEHQQLKVTVSVGAAIVAPTIDTSPDDLFKLADQCLYEAKEGGRNRVVSISA